MTTPIPEGFRVEPADYRRDFDTLRAIRDEVFVRGQNVPLEIELDSLDPLCLHVLARAEDGAAIGTRRLMPNGRIGRMVLLSSWRGRGVGGVMLERLVELAVDGQYGGFDDLLVKGGTGPLHDGHTSRPGGCALSVVGDTAL